MEKDYVSYLQEELSQRTEINPSYSLRAFARDLDVSASTLSEVLTGKHNLSSRTARKIISKLNLSELERENFLDLVAINEAPDQALQAKIISRIKARSQSAFGKMPIDLFKIISDWQHFAILEMTKVKGFRPDIHWISEQLELSVDIVSESVERLKQLGALEVTKNQWVVSPEFSDNFIGYDIPSEAIKKFHKQSMQKILGRLYSPIEVREFSSTLLPINKEDYKSICKLMKKFKTQAIAKSDSPGPKDELYLLGIQFVPVTNNFKENNHG